MKFYMIYSNQFATGTKPLGISTLAAVLKRAGNEFRLMDCTQFALGEGLLDLNQLGEVSLDFKPATNPERLPDRQRVTFEKLCSIIEADISDFGPDVIGLSALTDDYPLGINILRCIRNTFSTVPFIAGGIHATVDPDGVIREKCIDAICIGEAEEAIVEFANRINEKRSFEDAPNFWVKREDGTICKNMVRPLQSNLDLLPFPDWSIWPEVAFYKPYMGYVYKYGDFEMSRGCPYTCSYCINVGLQQVYKLTDNPTAYHREKSIDRVISEVKWAMETHGIEFLKFWDETFLLMSKKRLEEFHDKYRADCNVPYVIETTADSCTERSVQILRDTNCRSASLGMETGSPDLRKGVLNKPTKNQVYVDAFSRLKANGIRPVSFNMLGLPGERKADIVSTIHLNRICGTEAQSIGIFYPYKGTPIRRWIQDRGLMNEDYEYTQLQKGNFSTFTAGKASVLSFEDMDGEELLRIKEMFSLYVHMPLEVFPLIDYCRNKTGEFRDVLLLNLRRVLYRLKFNEDASSIVGSNPAIAKLGAVKRETALEAYEDPAFEKLRDIQHDVFRDLLFGWYGEVHFNQLVALARQIAEGQIGAEFVFNANVLEEELDRDTVIAIRHEFRNIAKQEALEKR
jgi:anaerobic magnesium-protoporphyrin IX monomethyl ester cyclase